MMIVFNAIDTPAYHTQLLETLMKLKHDVIKDLFCVIAHGTAKARCPAVELLFQYWPNLNPNALDRKQLAEKHAAWTPLTCQNDTCSQTIHEAVKLCIDHTIITGSNTEKAPPMLLCIECVDLLYDNRSRDTLFDILLPMEEIPYNCENKACKSPPTQKMAVATCFSAECTVFNCNKPIRYCAKCHEEKHSPTPVATTPGKNNHLLQLPPYKHVVHNPIDSPWQVDSETQSYVIEAIISLLKEAQPDKQSKDAERHSRIGFSTSEENPEGSTLEERQLLSRYGVWLMVGMCCPDETTPEDVLGRMLSMLCQWFHYTACLPDDQAGSALERLKTDCIQGWLMKKTHFNVFASCLLPHPMEYARFVWARDR